jgi:UDPglucose 6-dehydrogenase
MGTGKSDMKIAVTGLWHLGCVTAACLAKGGHDVLAYDTDESTIQNLQMNKPPISEPGLQELLQEDVAAGHLTFSADARTLVQSEIVWVCFDTPVDTEDGADVDFVVTHIKNILPFLQNNALVIISSQMPVGTIQKLISETDHLHPDKKFTFACIPENLRLGKALDIFLHPDRIVIGLDNLNFKNKIESLLKPFSDKLIWMSIVSAEMTKHAINSFLALSVTFINELSALCETVGASARDVEAGLKSEERIGAKAYLRPGNAIAGGTLMRDVHYLIELGADKQRDTLLLSAVLDSNIYHKKWVCRKLTDLLDNLSGKKIAMLGLTYKAGTDTLRRSSALETCEWLHEQGVEVHAYDPMIKSLPDDISRYVQIQQNANAALQSADAVVISTEWPDFKNLSADDFVTHLKHPRVLDASGFIAKNIGTDARIKYYSVGVST